MNKIDALTGALVADAAAMGLHWMYDVERLATLEASGEIMFRAPDVNVFAEPRDEFVHHTRHKGDLSHYGESARVVGQLVLNEDYSPAAHRAAFFASFGPCGTFNGYPDIPTKALIARMIIEGDQITEPSGMDDKQMPAYSVLPGLLAINADKATVIEAAKVISVHTGVISGVGAVYDLVELLSQGTSLPEALDQVAKAMDGELGELMLEALAMDGHQPVGVGVKFGRACYVEHSLPVIWHLLKHASDFESVARDNIRCCGDTCGRSMVLGAVAGLVFGVPKDLTARVTPGSLPVKF